MKSIFLWLLLFPAFLFPQITITEVMFDPIGSENTDEFVEIFNFSRLDTVDLSGWKLGDGSGSDAIADAGHGLLLGPLRFALILDPDYFGQSASYDSLIPPEALVVTVNGSTLGSGGLSNSRSETVTLFNGRGAVAGQYSYHIGNDPGYSDEKMDLSAPDSPSNWADGRVPLGTPGSRNSVEIRNVPGIAEMRIDPNPFSPDGDGFEDSATISFRFPFSSGNVTLRVFDVNGRLVRNLISGTPSLGEGRLHWDGRNENGQSVSAGLYVLLLEGLNADLCKAISARTWIAVASPL